MKKLNARHSESELLYADILPPGFDLHSVLSFFSDRGNDPHTEAHNSHPADHVHAAAKSALAAADIAAAADLHRVAKPLQDDWFQGGSEDETSQDSDIGSDPDGSSSADARPAHAGGNKDSDTSDGGGKFGRGKGKNKTDEEQTTTDPEATDPPPEEPAAEDPPADEPDAPADTGETNPGSTAPNTYVSGMDTPDGFNIELVFGGTWEDAARQAVIDASEVLSDYIIGDVVSHNGIDDIRINVDSVNIDGDGGVIGRGGWDTMNPETGTISLGHLTLDSSDIDLMQNKGILEETVMHEMLHSLGFGTAWWDQGLKQYYGADGNDIRFVGEKATAVYNSQYAEIASLDANSDIGVPIEDGGGSGARGKHWDESTFDGELMTTHVDNGEHITDLTLAALEDMGYETTFDEAEALLGMV